MVRVMKSPNMMSTTGRRPVMAAPTPTPVKPASEIGVSTTRSAPNSSTNPESTLNGVPASATSSPKIHTRESRRISSASASRTACANVSSRSGIHVLVDLIDAGIRRRDRELYRGLHLRAHFGGNGFKRCGIGIALSYQPVRVQIDGIALGLPLLLFLLGAVVFAIDVADVMTAVAIGIALQKRGASSGPGAFYQPRRDFVHRAHVLPVNASGFDAEGSGAAEDGPCRGFRVVSVFVVEIVFANVDNRQFPQLRQVHDFVKRSLSESSFTEEADGHAIGLEMLGRESRTCCNTHAAADNCVCAQVAGGGIGNVHRSAFAAAITSFFA